MRYHNLSSLKLINYYAVNGISRTMKWGQVLFPAKKPGLLGREKLHVSERKYLSDICPIIFFKKQSFFKN